MLSGYPGSQRISVIHRSTHPSKSFTISCRCGTKTSLCHRHRFQQQCPRLPVLWDLVSPSWAVKQEPCLSCSAGTGDVHSSLMSTGMDQLPALTNPSHTQKSSRACCNLHCPVTIFACWLYSGPKHPLCALLWQSLTIVTRKSRNTKAAEKAERNQGGASAV